MAGGADLRTLGRLGVWERLLEAAREGGVELGMAFLDGMSIRAHHKAATTAARSPTALACSRGPAAGDAAWEAAGAPVLLLVDGPEPDGAGPAPADEDLFARAFGLTPAEARLAARLASGASLTEAAGALGVTRNTARAQLRAVFDKTDVHRQGELVRLLHGARGLRLSPR